MGEGLVIDKSKTRNYADNLKKEALLRFKAKFLQIS